MVFCCCLVGFCFINQTQAGEEIQRRPEKLIYAFLNRAFWLARVKIIMFNISVCSDSSFRNQNLERTRSLTYLNTDYNSKMLHFLPSSVDYFHTTSLFLALPSLQLPLFNLLVPICPHLDTFSGWNIQRGKNKSFNLRLLIFFSFTDSIRTLLHIQRICSILLQLFYFITIAMNNHLCLKENLTPCPHSIDAVFACNQNNSMRVWKH